MRPPEEDYKIDVNSKAETSLGGRASLEHSLRLKIEDLCLDELKRSCSHFSADKYRRIEQLLLKIAGRIAEPLQSQMHEVNGARTNQAHGLRMIAEAFELPEVKRGR